MKNITLFAVKQITGKEVTNAKKDKMIDSNIICVQNGMNILRCYTCYTMKHPFEASFTPRNTLLHNVNIVLKQ